MITGIFSTGTKQKKFNFIGVKNEMIIDIFYIIIKIFYILFKKEVIFELKNIINEVSLVSIIPLCIPSA